MRADRLISLLMLLQTRGRMTTRELSTVLEVSERTIYLTFAIEPKGSPTLKG
jgi:predicted DNA-binding transcriptional regulator YafY